MSDTLALGLAWAAGAALGTIFFGGLWWTVTKLVSSPQPARWMLGSMLLRTGIALAGFYFVAGGRWERLVACLVGFLCARLLVTWWTRTPAETRPAAREATHAP